MNFVTLNCAQLESRTSLSGALLIVNRHDTVNNYSAIRQEADMKINV